MNLSNLRLLTLFLSLACAACAQVPTTAISASASSVAMHPAGHSDAGSVAPAPTAERQEQDDKFGLHFESLRVSGAGLLLDFRYRVTDPEKAKGLVNRQVRPVLIDPVSKLQLQVPHAENIGTLRHMGSKLISGRSYSVLFANPGRGIKAGAKVNLVMGSLSIDGVIVE